MPKKGESGKPDQTCLEGSEAAYWAAHGGIWRKSRTGCHECEPGYDFWQEHKAHPIPPKSRYFDTMENVYDRGFKWPLRTRKMCEEHANLPRPPEEAKTMPPDTHRRHMIYEATLLHKIYCLQKELEKARERGYTTTWEEMTGILGLPPGRNFIES
jgi:hypothetical protein